LAVCWWSRAACTGHRACRPSSTPAPSDRSATSLCSGRCKLQQKAEDPSTATHVFGATSHRANGSLLTTPTIFLGDLEVADLQVTFGDFEVFRLWNLESEPAIVIGMDVLGTVDALMIDYRRAELRVLSREPASKTSRSARRAPAGSTEAVGRCPTRASAAESPRRTSRPAGFAVARTPGIRRSSGASTSINGAR
jgi:hypothetical protein